MTESERPRTWPILVVLLTTLPAQLVASGGTLLVALLVAGVDLQDSEAVQAWIADWTASPVGLTTLTAVTLLVYALLALAGAAFSPEGLSGRLALRATRGGLRAAGLVLLGSLGMLMAVQAGFEQLVDEPSEHLRRISEAIASARGTTALVLVLVLSLGPGLVEELFFRGYVQSRLVAAWGAWAGIPCAAVLFALAHVDPQHVLAVLPLGLWFGLVAWLGGSTLLSMLAHTTNNLAAFLLARWLGEGADDRLGLPLWWLAALVVPLACGLLLAGLRERARGAASAPS